MSAALRALPAFVLLALPVSAADPPSWSVEGRWVDTCLCALPCPCWKKEKPTFGHCSEMFFFHVDKGHYGATRLDGVEVVQVASSAEGKTTSQSRKDKDYTISNLYLPAHLDPAAAAAAASIFSRLAFSGPIAKLHATKEVQIKSQLTADRLKIEIPGILLADVRMHKDAGGAPEPFVYPTTNLPWIGPGIQGESEIFEFHDDGVSWSVQHRHATFAHFSYSSERGPLPWEPGFSAQRGP